MHNVFRDISDHFLGRYVDSLWSLEGLNAKTSWFIKNKNKTIPRFPSETKSFPIPVPLVLSAGYQVGSQSIGILAVQDRKENHTSTKNVKPTFWSLFQFVSFFSRWNVT